MTREEAIQELQNCKDLIKQDGQDYLDERDYPLLDIAIEALSAEAVQGEWIKDTDCEGKTRTITCSKCGWVQHSWVDFNYCPSCGARMEKGKKNDNG